MQGHGQCLGLRRHEREVLIPAAGAEVEDDHITVDVQVESSGRSVLFDNECPRCLVEEVIHGAVMVPWCWVLIHRRSRRFNWC